MQLADDHKIKTTHNVLFFLEKNQYWRKQHQYIVMVVYTQFSSNTFTEKEKVLKLTRSRQQTCILCVLWGKNFVCDRWMAFHSSFPTNTHTQFHIGQSSVAVRSYPTYISLDITGISNQKKIKTPSTISLVLFSHDVEQQQQNRVLSRQMCLSLSCVNIR